MSDDGVDQFIERSRLLSDYVVYSGSEEGTDLIKALKEFDEQPELRDAEALANLREATRKACRTIEPHTLAQVLNGRSPIRFGKRRSWVVRLGFSGFVVLLIGVFLLISALHYTRWSTQAELTLAGIDDRARSDYSQLLRDFAEQSILVEEELAGVDVTPALGQGSLDDFIETIDQLKYFHVRQNSLFADANRLLADHDLLAGAKARIRDGIAAVEQLWRADAPAEPLPATNAAATPPADPLVELWTMNAKALEDLEKLQARGNGNRAADAGIAELKASLEKVNASVDALHMSRAGWSLDENRKDIAGEHFRSYVTLRETWLMRMGVTEQSDPERKKALFQNIRQELAGLLDLTNRWYFPLIYGALGAVIFSLSRHLNVTLSSPPLETTILRVLFASFAAISISMIFIPSSAFSIGQEISPTFMFLVCFIFGYSIESFLKLLRRIDTGISERLIPSGGRGR